MQESDSRSVTRILLEWRAGDANALDELMPLVYEELRRLAAHYMRGESSAHTLQPTALVHDAYLRLIKMDLEWQDRAHFFAVAARLMRRLLVDHAKTKHRVKRGGGLKVTLSEDLPAGGGKSIEIVALDEAMSKLSCIDERKSRIVELHFFGGLTYDETAEALSISAATVDRELRFAKAWLYRELEGDRDDA